MTRSQIIKIADAVAILAVAHIFMYAFTGLSFVSWVPVTPEGGIRVLLIVMCHVAALLAPLGVRTLS